MPLFSEKSLVEDYFIQNLQEKGWKYVPADNLERENLEEPLLTPMLIRSLKRLNAGIGVGDEEIKQVLRVKTQNQRKRRCQKNPQLPQRRHTHKIRKRTSGKIRPPI